MISNFKTSATEGNPKSKPAAIGFRMVIFVVNEGYLYPLYLLCYSTYYLPIKSLMFDEILPSYKYGYGTESNSTFWRR